MHSVYLNIGSNLGGRHALIEQAVALICQRYPEAGLRRSEFVSSEPWGFVSENQFLNLGIALDFTTLPDPIALLSTLQQIEKEISAAPHRNADGSYRDRAIDIDIIAIDCLTIKRQKLQIPHPRAHLRHFVMGPLAQLAPEQVVKHVIENGNGR